MNLVFFDIECASVTKYTAKICAFGYVICDENFNIIKKEDILVNPKGSFRLTDRKGEQGIVLPYAYDDFKNYPPFRSVYGFIKELLENRDNVVLGHSTMNDVKYLNLETRRFKLPSFEFAFSDSQLIYMAYKNDYTRQMGLETIANELGVEFTPHRAADDAYATMRVVEAMCRAEGCGYFELIQKLRMKNGRIKNYSVFAPTSGGEKEYHDGLNKLKRERAAKRTQYFNYVSRKKIKRGGKFYGKIFTFARSIEDDLPLAERLADLIYLNGGRYSQRLTQSDFYVADDNDDTQRTVNAQKLESVAVISLEQLEAMLT